MRCRWEIGECKRVIASLPRILWETTETPDTWFGLDSIEIRLFGDAGHNETRSACEVSAQDLVTAHLYEIYLTCVYVGPRRPPHPASLAWAQKPGCLQSNSLLFDFDSWC